jgi:hypothetical protein
MNLPSTVVTVTVYFLNSNIFKQHILKQTMVAINMNNGFEHNVTISLRIDSIRSFEI